MYHRTCRLLFTPVLDAVNPSCNLGQLPTVYTGVRELQFSSVRFVRCEQAFIHPYTLYTARLMLVYLLSAAGENTDHSVRCVLRITKHRSKVNYTKSIRI